MRRYVPPPPGHPAAHRDDGRPRDGSGADLGGRARVRGRADPDDARVGRAGRPAQRAVAQPAARALHAAARRQVGLRVWCPPHR